MTNNRNNMNDREMVRRVYDNYYGDPGIRAIREDQIRQQKQIAREMEMERRWSNESNVTLSGKVVGYGLLVVVVLIYCLLESIGIIA